MRGLTVILMRCPLPFKTYRFQLDPEIRLNPGLRIMPQHQNKAGTAPGTVWGPDGLCA